MKNFNSSHKLKSVSCFENTRNYIKLLLSLHNHLSPYKSNKTELYLTKVSEVSLHEVWSIAMNHFLTQFWHASTSKRKKNPADY